MEAAAGAATAAAQERCTMPPVQSAESSVKFHSSPMAPGRYIAASATRSTGLPGHPADTKRFDYSLIDQPLGIIRERRKRTMQGAHQCPCEFLRNLSLFELLNFESDRKVYLQVVLFIKSCISSIQSVFVEMFFVACSVLLNRYKRLVN